MKGKREGEKVDKLFEKKKSKNDKKQKREDGKK